MYFMIDFDRRKVDAVSKDGEDLAAYILANDLGNAVALIEDEDELSLEFSLREMVELYANYVDKPRDFPNEDEAATHLMSQLTACNSAGRFPTFTNKLSKKLLKEAMVETPTRNTKPAKDKALSNKSVDSTKPGSRVTAKSLQGKTIICGPTEPKAGTAHHTNYAFVEENLGEATLEELLDNFVFERDSDEKKAMGYITGAFRKGYLEIKE